jgi:putative phosphoesterase
MRIAALYDVHGNLPALEAVLAEVERESVDTVVCGGDVVFGPYPAECLARLRELGAVFVRGNCERELAEGGDEGVEWIVERLDGEALGFAAGLPLTVRLGDVLFCHATPRDDEEIVTTLTPEPLVRDAFAGVDAPLVVVGHTHRQYERDLGATRVANAGSVGLPYEGSRGAFWALLDGTEVEHRRTEYDVDAALARLVEPGWPVAETLFARSLADPVAADEAAASFERRAGRGA